ncbi:hypothetical protein CLOSTMETH_01135 [[Clostridium] methylpentosum DSM 5476]|uniref:Uncharacterized protein n=1 Tax=[Clostridium] methylpentosum DSM 5476 TaxID=537013 RepID=C0EBB7_9FIRM|nr:hypothetical protein CLOSTMETH_01135 [[Clostridium] methylpentosum DSM 5476]
MVLIPSKWIFDSLNRNNLQAIPLFNVLWKSQKQKLLFCEISPFLLSKFRV